MRRLIAGRRRLEHRIRLARIGVEAKHQELGRDRAEVDRAVDQRLRPILERHLDLSALSSSSDVAAGGNEDDVDRFVDLVLDRLERHHAGLADRRRHVADHVQAAAAVPGHVEAGLQARQGGKPGELGDRRARLRIGDEIEMPAGFGHLAIASGTLQARADSRASPSSLRALAWLRPCASRAQQHLFGIRKGELRALQIRPGAASPRTTART